MLMFGEDSVSLFSKSVMRAFRKRRGFRRPSHALGQGLNYF